MKQPDCVASISELVYEGNFRPRFFFVVEVESRELGMKFRRFVLGRKLLLRVRLWLAYRECLAMVRKTKAFTNNNGLISNR